MNAVPIPKLPFVLPKKVQPPSGRHSAARAQSVPEPLRSSLRQSPMASAPRPRSGQMARARAEREPGEGEQRAAPEA